jgi:hypothetical protein
MMMLLLRQKVGQWQWLLMNEYQERIKKDLLLS